MRLRVSICVTVLQGLFRKGRCHPKSQTDEGPLMTNTVCDDLPQPSEKGRGGESTNCGSPGGCRCAVVVLCARKTLLPPRPRCGDYLPSMLPNTIHVRTKSRKEKGSAYASYSVVQDSPRGSSLLQRLTQHERYPPSWGQQAWISPPLPRLSQGWRGFCDDQQGLQLRVGRYFVPGEGARPPGDNNHKFFRLLSVQD